MLPESNQTWTNMSRILKPKGVKIHSLAPRWGRRWNWSGTFKGQHKPVRQNLDKLGQRIKYDKTSCHLPSICEEETFPWETAIPCLVLCLGFNLLYTSPSQEYNVGMDPNDSWNPWGSDKENVNLFYRGRFHNQGTHHSKSKQTNFKQKWGLIKITVPLRR